MLRPSMFRPTVHIFVPLLKPRQAPLLRSLQRLKTSTCIRTLASRRTSPSSPVGRPRQWEKPRPIEQSEQPEQPEQTIDESNEKDNSMRILILFALISVPITVCYQFPTTMLPPVPDPVLLSHLSHTPLTLSRALTSPYQSLQLFVFRLHRGEYKSAMNRNFAVIPANFLGIDTRPESLWRRSQGRSDGGPTEPLRWWTLATHMFTHSSVFHWGFCFVALSSLAPVMVVRYGIARTSALFLGGGVGGAALECSLEAVLRGDRVRRGEGVVTTVQRDGRQAIGFEPGFMGMFLPHVGSSAGLMGMFIVSAVTMPQMKWGLMFIPIHVPSRYMLAALVGWDVVGALGYGPQMGIGHLGHLCGDVAGLLVYALWLRRLPVSRMLKVIRKRGGFW